MRKFQHSCNSLSVTLALCSCLFSCIVPVLADQPSRPFTLPDSAAPGAGQAVLKPTPVLNGAFGQPLTEPAYPSKLQVIQDPTSKTTATTFTIAGDIPVIAQNSPPSNSASGPVSSPSPSQSSSSSPSLSAPASGPVSAPVLDTQGKPMPSIELQPLRLTDEENKPMTHDEAKTLHLSPLYLSRAIEMNSFEALRKETSVTQEITLAEAINYVLDQGMSIKISRESMNYQHRLFQSGIASFLPTFSANYNLTYANVYNDKTTSLAQTFLTGVNIPVFQGGSVLYSLLAQRYREKAWQEAYTGTVSDVFLDVYTKYTNVILQRVLLQTLAKAVEADEEQLRLSKKQLEAGTGTRYAIMQVEALLSSDKQRFLQQAVNMRTAGLVLNAALNFPMAVNLVPAERTLSEVTLFDDNVRLRTLLQDAMKYSSGLRQYEYFRLAAARTVQSVSSSLYPTASFFVLYQVNDASVAPAANGAALGGAATSAIASFLDTSFAGRVSNNALGQQYTFSPTAGSTSSQGANTAPSSMPAASGGTPIAQVQSGSLVSSGAVAPSLFGGGSGNSTGSNQNGSLQAPAGIFPGDFREFQAGFSLSWSLPSFGLQTAATVQAVRLLARQALMQCNQELGVVTENVRSDYLSILAARKSIDQAAAATVATREAMRYARARLANGVDTWLDLVRAQHDYVAALATQAQAIGTSNIAQAQLLHDMGMISATTLTKGYTPGSFEPAIPTGRKSWYKP